MVRERYNAENINAAALAVFPMLLAQWLPNGEQRGETYFAINPHRDDRKLGSFQIDTRSGRWRDHAIGVGGRDAISLFAYLKADGNYGIGARLLANEPIVRGAIASGATAPAAKPANLAKSAANTALARTIYERGSRVEDTAAEAYLRKRGLRPTSAWDGLRTSKQPYPGLGWHPTLIGPFLTLGGVLSGVQRTYLQPNGAKLDANPARLMLGHISGCAIRLGNPADELVICEGLEDGLTLHQELDGIPVWVAGGAGFLSTMRIPDTVKRLIVAADNDEAGERAARQTADLHSFGNRQCWIRRPSPAFKDFNDELRGIKRGS